MIRLHDWCDQAEAGLIVSGGRDLPELKRQVQTGIAQLWKCEKGHRVAWCVTRLDRDAAGDEWVICLFEGTGLHEFIPLFVQAADEKGIPLRAHLNAKRPGLLRMVQRYGFEPTEIVVRKREQ